MFGDLELYRSADFFRDSGGGSLILPERSFRLIPAVCFQCPASEPLVFDPEYAGKNLDRLLDYAESHAEQQNTETLAAARDERKILALTSCSTDYTDSRTVA